MPSSVRPQTTWRQRWRRWQGNRTMTKVWLGPSLVGTTELDVLHALAQGADPDHPSRSHPTKRALAWSVEQRCFELVVELLDAGANPDQAEPEDGGLLLETLYRHRTPRLNLFARTVLAWGTMLSVGSEPTSRWPQRAVQAFLERGVDPGVAGPHDHGTWTTPLHLLAMVHPTLIGVPETLLRTLGPTGRDHQGRTAAHILIASAAREIPSNEGVPRLVMGLTALANAGARLDHDRDDQGHSVLDALMQHLLQRRNVALGERLSEVLNALDVRCPGPGLRWDLAPPQGGPSPMAQWMAFLHEDDPLLSGMSRANKERAAGWLQRIETRALQSIADETLSTSTINEAHTPRARL